MPSWKNGWRQSFLNDVLQLYISHYNHLKALESNQSCKVVSNFEQPSSLDTNFRSDAFNSVTSTPLKREMDPFAY